MPTNRGRPEVGDLSCLAGRSRKAERLSWSSTLSSWRHHSSHQAFGHSYLQIWTRHTNCEFSPVLPSSEDSPSTAWRSKFSRSNFPFLRAWEILQCRTRSLSPRGCQSDSFTKRYPGARLYLEALSRAPPASLFPRADFGEEVAGSARTPPRGGRRSSQFGQQGLPAASQATGKSHLHGGSLWLFTPRLSLKTALAARLFCNRDWKINMTCNKTCVNKGLQIWLKCTQAAEIVGRKRPFFA